MAKKQDEFEPLEDGIVESSSSSVKTMEEIALIESVKLNFNTKAESDAGGFQPLAEGLYQVTVDNIMVKERAKFQEPDVMEKVIVLQFNIDKCLTEDAIKDVDGKVEEADKRKYWEWLSSTSLGFTRGGEPSKTRACICALLKKSVDEEKFELDDLNELQGKTCKVYLSVTKKGDKVFNKSVKYSQA